jgi:asparagine synthase (glutamine-hydrolysing)
LKATFADVLPKQIIKRRKHGFNVPIDYWFKNVLKDELIRTLEANSHGLYDKQYVYDLLDRMQVAGQNYKLNFLLAQKLWAIFVFEKWYEKYIQSVRK